MVRLENCVVFNELIMVGMFVIDVFEEVVFFYVKNRDCVEDSMFIFFFIIVIVFWFIFL